MMRVILDTHVLLWALAGSSRLSKTAKRIITDQKNEIYVSAVSTWEIVIKRAQGKLRIPEDLISAIHAMDFLERPIRYEECEQLIALPSLHRDPFDRMLVAQALTDGVPIVTADEMIKMYPVQTIW